MSEPSALVDVEGGVATITLNRPSVMNALDLALARALVRALGRCAADPAIRAVVLTGNGRAFCAGGDMRAAWEHIHAGGVPREFFGTLTVELHRIVADLRLAPKPVIAAVNAVAAGAGMSLAAACDIRIAADTARFKQAYTSIGLVPDGGWTALIPQIVGPARAMDLVLSDPVLDAPQALALGLVHEVVPAGDLAARAGEMAARLARGAVEAFGRTKALLNASLTPSLETQLERERQAIMRQSESPEFLERLEAFVGKRSGGE